MIEYGLLSPLYRILKDAWAALRKAKRSPSPAEVVQLRQKWKGEFESKLWERRQAGQRSDVIVRDVKRIDSYPDTDGNTKGISPWFRVGLMGTYHRGILLGLRWGSLVREESGWKYRNYKKEEAGKLKVILIGYVPYENIEAVDWEGDEFYGFPHLYCHFDARSKEPYERCAFCEQQFLDETPFYTEVAEYDAVHKRSRKHGLEYFS